MFRLMREYLHSYLHLNHEDQSLPDSQKLLKKKKEKGIILSLSLTVSIVYFLKSDIYLHYLPEPGVVHTLLA